MVLDAQSYPIVAWEEAMGNGPRSLHVARWNGSLWSALGRAVAKGSDLYSLEPKLALDASGQIWIAWNGGTTKRSYVRVARWDGAVWRDVGQSRSGRLHHSDREVRGPQLLMLPHAQMLVAWLERGTKDNSLALARWNGEKMGGGAIPASNPGERAAALDSISRARERRQPTARLDRDRHQRHFQRVSAAS